MDLDPRTEAMKDYKDGLVLSDNPYKPKTAEHREYSQVMGELLEAEDAMQAIKIPDNAGNVW